MEHSASIDHGTACGPSCQMLSAHPPQEAGLARQAGEFFSGLFDTSDWPPRWHCGNWSDFHGWLYIVSDLVIWAAYFAIPLLLFQLISKRKDLPFSGIFWLFASFIVLCGTTHLLDAIIFWWPGYRLSALVRLATGVVSLFTVAALYKILPSVLSLRSVEELQKEIAERRKVEEKLAASEFLLSETGQVARVGGWERDVVTGEANWSKAVYDILGLPEGSDINNMDTMQLFPEDDRARLLDAVSLAKEQGIGWDLELKMKNVAGELIWVKSVGNPQRGDDGKVRKLRGIFMDIDSFKKNELALSKSMELLTRQNQQLKSFTHILSHNIRNHSSNISLLASMIDKEKMDPENAEIFHMLGKAAFNLNTTLDDLSEAIKIKESKMQSEPVSFAQITARVMEVLGPDLNANGGKLETDFQVAEIMYPRIYMESIIMNMVSNGIKYRKEDIPPHIMLRTYRDERGVTILECTDNGIGIDLELHGDRLFGLYKTFHVRKDAHGVGLFLIKNQVESQGGEILAYSKPDQGTTFKILFYEQN